VFKQIIITSNLNYFLSNLKKKENCICQNLDVYTFKLPMKISAQLGFITSAYTGNITALCYWQLQCKVQKYWFRMIKLVFLPTGELSVHRII